MHQSLIAKHFVGVAWVLSLAGCSALINVSDKQCSADAECVSAGLGTMCVDHVCKDPEGDTTCTSDKQCGMGTTPYCMRGTCVDEDLAQRFLCAADTPATHPATINYKVDVVYYQTTMAPKGLVVRACASADPDCTRPYTYTDTEGLGHVELDLPYGFVGFFELMSDATPSYSYISKPLTQDTKDRMIHLPNASQIDTLAAVSGVAVEPSKGVILVEAFDCMGEPQAGVHFTESTNTSTPFYMVTGLPSKTAQTSVYNPGSDSADGGFVNVQAGSVLLTASWSTDGPTIGSANIVVRPGTMTYVDMHF